MNTRTDTLLESEMYDLFFSNEEKNILSRLKSHPEQNNVRFEEDRYIAIYHGKEIDKVFRTKVEADTYLLKAYNGGFEIPYKKKDLHPSKLKAKI